MTPGLYSSNSNCFASLLCNFLSSCFDVVPLPFSFSCVGKLLLAISSCLAVGIHVHFLLPNVFEYGLVGFVNDLSDLKKQKKKKNKNVLVVQKCQKNILKMGKNKREVIIFALTAVHST